MSTDTVGIRLKIEGTVSIASAVERCKNIWCVDSIARVYIVRWGVDLSAIVGVQTVLNCFSVCCCCCEEQSAEEIHIVLVS